MRLVIDTNILFTYFWKNSFTKKLILKSDLELFAPEYALEEIKYHMQEILNKTKISKQEFIKLREELALIVKFIPPEDYSNLFKDVMKSIPDSKDIDFLALALKLSCPIWSNDPDLKKQDKIKIFTTKEIIQLI